MQLKPIREQVVVVFGASSGIGREAALQFARRGAKVVVAARGADGLNSLVEEIRQHGGEATVVVADAALFDEVSRVAHTAVETYGRIDTWAHLAAVSIWASFEQTTPEEFRRIIEVNLLGQIYGAKAALPHLMREGRGALIHVSSVEARRALPLQSAYAASKHGITGFVEALRMELEHERVPISVTEIMPATINTPLFDKARTKLGVKPKGLPPVYPPSLVAEAILDAAEHPTREIPVGGAARVILATQRLSPRLADRLLERTGFEGQRSDRPKSAEAPDNLLVPLPGFDRVEGDLVDERQPRRMAGQLVQNRTAQWLAAGAALGAVALLAGRSHRNGH